MLQVYDATNSVRSRREMICRYIDEWGYKIFFVESVCFDPEVIEANIRVAGNFSYTASLLLCVMLQVPIDYLKK